MLRKALVVFMLLGLTGCSQEPAATRVNIKAAIETGPARGPAEALALAQPAIEGDDGKTVDNLVAKYTAPAKQDRYETAMNEAAGYLAEKKYARALVALEDARGIDDNEPVRREIDKARALIAEQAAIEHTTNDVRAVLAEGKADDAGVILTSALKQYGGSDAADELSGLKRQADTLRAVALPGDVERRERFGREARAAVEDNNLRVAALALEQALQAGEDAELRRQFDALRDRLGRYDDARFRASNLHRDPSRLEDALAALREAGQAWDTLQVRQEIDECTLALQRRRDRVAVADFEVRGEVGIPAAGRAVAEELLPVLKARFDVVEREQINRVLTELQLEAGELAASDFGQQEVGRLARVRYLIVGSVYPLSGVTINARLVEVSSGLVVQTAKLNGPSIDAVMRRLPQLGQMLMMNDEQKLAFEQALTLQAPQVQPVPLEAPLPPIPVLNEPAPPPIIAYSARPPAFGGLLIVDFARLPPPVPAAEIVIVQEDPFRRRLLSVALELGDNLFRRGRHREAFVHYELALGLSNGQVEVARRVEECRPLVPPPVVIVQPAPGIIRTQPAIYASRPRLAVFNFLVNSEPGLVPPAVGDWAADQFVSYCGSSFEVVERGEICWYMGRLNITMKDVLYNPAARRALSQALNVRYFLFGTIQQTASFDVSAHMIDANTGAATGTGMIHVQDHNEIKLRMQELVRQTGAGKVEQAQMAKVGAASENVLTEAPSNSPPASRHLPPRRPVRDCRRLPAAWRSWRWRSRRT